MTLLPVVPGTQTARSWAFYMQTYHYLGLRVVGENLGCLARDARSRNVAALLFGAPAWRCAPRERALGWTEPERRAQLHTLANNTRFLRQTEQAILIEGREWTRRRLQEQLQRDADALPA